MAGFAFPSRLAASLALGAVTSLALFLTMKILVTGQEFEIEQEARALAIDFVRVARDESVTNKDRALKRPSQEKPEQPPPPPKLQPASRPNIDKAAMGVDLGQFALDGMNLNVPVDGDALAIVRVPPSYPSRAAARGVEGWVLLKFAIDPLGRAADLEIIDSEPPGVFDRAALAAVKKWKYRPMVENSRAVTRQGVHQRFRFQITK